MGTIAIASLVLSSGITSAFLQVVFDKLANLALKKIGQKNVEVADQLQQLGRTLLKIESLVDDAESKNSNSNACQMLIDDFKNALFDADDLLDKIDLQKLNSGEVDLSSLKSDLKGEVVEMLKKVVDLVTEMEVYFMSEISKRRERPPQTWAMPDSSSLVDEASVIGREQEKGEIVELLLAEQGENVSVIPIEGMGGTGKTTLAQLAYNDVAVVQNFQLRMWVCASLDSDLVKITKCIYESAAEKVLELSNLDSVQIKLQEILRSKKFLLVIDGMWNENPGFWDALKLPFRFAEPGSRILVTTRSEIVSKIVSTGPAYPLHTFSDHQVCWEIMKTSLGGNLEGREDLEEIGIEMAKKCKGLPLAAKVIGNVLRFKSEEMERDAVLHCELWDFPEDYKNQIYSVLKVSYDHLPAYLKRCFAYCSIFPQSFQFDEDDLIQLWAAEGFIQAQGTRRIEDIGRGYFDFLRSKYFFQVSSNGTGPTGNRRYEMNYFIHCLARLVSANLCFRMDQNHMERLLPVSRNVRHSSLLFQNMQPSVLEEFHRYNKLRTFILLPEDASNLTRIPPEYFSKLPCLRVLNLSHSCISELDESIGILFHLRYLNLNSTQITTLPKSLVDIHGLEVLKLENCSKLRKLPENLKNLVKLRHLDLHSFRKIGSMPKEVGKLTSLETLHEFRVGKLEGYQIGELKTMRCLRGSIRIENLENVENKEEAKTALLHEKKHLENLELHWSRGTRDATVEQEVLAGLEPHGRLKRLHVIGYLGSEFPNWMGNSSFCKLESILLEDCKVCSILPSLGELPALKYLVIQYMDTLTEVHGQFCGSPGSFPSLETLTFRNMPRLRMWSDINESGMPRLTKLSIDGCPELVTLPSVHNLTSLQNLSILDCHELPTLPDLPYSLKRLIIYESPILKERCNGIDGEDWNKIQFIPEVTIDDEEIPTEGPI